MLPFTITICLFCCILICLYLYLTRNFNYWKKRGVPYEPPVPVFGNLSAIILLKQSIGEHMRNLYNKQDVPFLGLYAVDTPILLIRDLDLVKSVLVKDFSYFMNHNVKVNFDNDPLVAYALFVLKDDPWKQLRAKLTPCFTAGKIKQMFPLIQSCVDDLCNIIEKNLHKNKPFMMKRLLSQYTTDVISSCVFGVKGNALENPDNDHIYQIGRELFDPDVRLFLKLALAFIAPDIGRLLKLKIVEQKTNDRCRNTFWSTVKYRDENNVKRNDFVDILMELRDKSLEDAKNNVDSEVLTGDRLAAQAFIFILAGYETTSTLLSFTCYELARHPDVQEKLRREIKACIDKYNGELTYDCVKEMKYMEQVLNETLRLYPPLPFLDRVCIQSYQIPGTNVTIEPGTAVFISLSGIHKDSKYFPNPEIFDPENFSDINVEKRNKFAFMPFGEGPRYCIGSRFGFLKSKLTIAMLLSKFKIELSADTPIPLPLSPLSLTTCSAVDIPLNIITI